MTEAWHESEADLLWVHETTGEVSEIEADGFFPVLRDGVVPPEGAIGKGLGDWVTKRLAQLDGEESALKAAFQQQVRRIKSERAGIMWVHTPGLQAFVEASIEGGKKKSLVFAYGTAGFRTSKTVEVLDEVAAMEWAAQHYPDAVKIPEPRLLKSKLPKGKDVPGVERVTENRFYIRPAKRKEGNDDE